MFIFLMLNIKKERVWLVFLKCREIIRSIVRKLWISWTKFSLHYKTGEKGFKNFFSYKTCMHTKVQKVLNIFKVVLNVTGLILTSSSQTWQITHIRIFPFISTNILWKLKKKKGLKILLGWNMQHTYKILLLIASLQILFLSVRISIEHE